jgi:hypothetical protein
MPCSLATPLEQDDPFAAIFGPRRGKIDERPRRLRELEARSEGATEAVEHLMRRAEEAMCNVSSEDYVMVAALHHDDVTYSVALWGLVEARSNIGAMLRNFTAQELVDGAIRALRRFYEGEELGWTYESHYAGKVQPPPESVAHLFPA